MSMNSTNSSLSLNDLLYALAMDERDDRAAVLDEFVRDHPEHAKALMEFAIELAADALRPDALAEASEPTADPAKVSPAVSRAMSRFHNRLYSVRQVAAAGAKQASPGASAPNPFASLDRGAFRTFANELGCNTVIAAKLRDRQIEPETMTPGFLQRVADLLKSPLDAIKAHFAAPVHVPLRPQFFKADQQPTAGTRQSFKDAVESSELSEEQQRRLLGL